MSEINSKSRMKRLAIQREEMSEPTQEEELERMRAAINLIWAVYVRKETHLGLERASGLERNCIPCICALALGRSMDGAATAAEFDAQRAIVCNDSAHAGEAKP